MTEWLVVYFSSESLPIQSQFPLENTGFARHFPKAQSPTMTEFSSSPAPAIKHYENFPVASFLCPPALRSPIAAIYHFARTADDLADEGDASAAQRLSDLAAYREELRLASQGQVNPESPWAWVFGPLTQTLHNFKLPVQLLHDLLDAFVQDVEKTRDTQSYADTAELRDYCRRSANPVGRLLLHLYGIIDDKSLAKSDGICTALQLINFLQDVAIDSKKSRIYIPQEDLAKFNVSEQSIPEGKVDHRWRALMQFQVTRARSLILKGAPLATHVGGRLGWELRFIVHGGLRILEKIEAVNYDVFQRRPTLKKYDWLLLGWRALRYSSTVSD
jgi:phytoene synthase